MNIIGYKKKLNTNFGELSEEKPLKNLNKFKNTKIEVKKILFFFLFNKYKKFYYKKRISTKTKEEKVNALVKQYQKF